MLIRARFFFAELRGTLFVLGLLLATSGCAQPLAWVRAGADAGQTDQQLAACTLQAEQAAYSSEESSEARVARSTRWTNLCMRANGWHQEARGE